MRSNECIAKCLGIRSYHVAPDRAVLEKLLMIHAFAQRCSLPVPALPKVECMRCVLVMLFLRGHHTR